jgi:hypothetical protein
METGLTRLGNITLALLLLSLVSLIILSDKVRSQKSEPRYIIVNVLQSGKFDTTELKTTDKEAIKKILSRNE